MSAVASKLDSAMRTQQVRLFFQTVTNIIPLDILANQIHSAQALKLSFTHEQALSTHLSL